MAAVGQGGSGAAAAHATGPGAFDDALGRKKILRCPRRGRGAGERGGMLRVFFQRGPARRPAAGRGAGRRSQCSAGLSRYWKSPGVLSGERRAPRAPASRLYAE